MGCAASTPPMRRLATWRNTADLHTPCENLSWLRAHREVMPAPVLWGWPNRSCLRAENTSSTSPTAGPHRVPPLHLHQRSRWHPLPRRSERRCLLCPVLRQRPMHRPRSTTQVPCHMAAALSRFAALHPHRAPIRCPIVGSHSSAHLGEGWQERNVRATSSDRRTPLG